LATGPTVWTEVYQHFRSAFSADKEGFFQWIIPSCTVIQCFIFYVRGSVRKRVYIAYSFVTKEPWDIPHTGLMCRAITIHL